MEFSSIGALASIAGLIVSVVGFVWAINVATSARTAAREARQVVRDVDSVVELTTAVELADSIRNAIGLSSWSSLPDKYSRQRRSLINLRGSNDSLSREQKKTIQSIVTKLKTDQDKIEFALSIEEDPDNPYKLMSRMAATGDVLQELLVDLKKHAVFQQRRLLESPRGRLFPATIE